MFDCTLEGFALSQMQIAAMCKRTKASEADTIEKLILPVLYRLYWDVPLFIERASRATSGENSKRWDVQFYRLNLDRLNKGCILGVAECKSIGETIVLPTKEWDFKSIIRNEWDKENKHKRNNLQKIGNGPPRCVHDYITRGFTSANRDFLLQVWMNEYRYNPNRDKEFGKRICSNGETWIVFKEAFFKKVDGNPPPIKIGNGVHPSDNIYYAVLTFPIEKSEENIRAWCESFGKLQEMLNPKKSKL